MSINKFRIIFLIIILILPIIISAQAEKKYYFENISIPDGLSNTQVWDIIQDKYGFLWIATLDGLNMYDGYNIKIFKNDPENPNTLPNNQVKALLIDKNENLLIGSRSGLSIYDRVSGLFTTHYVDSNSITSLANLIYQIYEDSKGRFWLGTGMGVYQFNFENKKFSLAEIKNDENTILSDVYVRSIIESSAGDIYAGTGNKGLIKYNESLNLFERLNTTLDKQNPLIDNLIMKIYEDKTGKLWIGTKGLFTYEPRSKRFNKIELFESKTFKNGHPWVTNFYQDESGYLWITTNNQGIVKYNLRTNEHEKLTQNSFPSGVSFNDPFFKFYLDDFGVLWVATWSKGVLKLDFQKEPFLLYEKPGGANSSNNELVIFSLLKSNDNANIVWLGTSEGFYKYDLKDKSFRKYENIRGDSKSLPSNTVNSIVDGGNSDLWLGTDNGLSYFNTVNNTFTNYQLIEETDHYKINYNLVRNGSMDEYGNLWLATGEGIVKFDTKIKTMSFIRVEEKHTYGNKLYTYIDSLHKKQRYLSSILEVGNYQDLTQEFEIEEKINLLLVSVGEGIDGMWDYGSLTDSNGDILFIHHDSTEVFKYFGGNWKNRIYAKLLSLNKGKYKLRYVSDESHSFGNWNTVPPKDSTWWGIQAFNVDDNDLDKVNSWISEDENQIELQGTTVSTVKYQKEGSLIVGTDKGFSKYFVSKNSIENYHYPNGIPNTTNTRQINDIIVDSENIIWLATQGGLIRYDQYTKEYNIIYDKDGLPSNSLQALLEDNYGNLWISTLNGISKFNKDVQIPILINYDVQDGLQSYTFSPQASYQSDNGELFFGGINGFNAFMSGNINKILPKVNIVEFKINNKTVLPTDEESPLKTTILETKDLVLEYSQNNISFEFNSIHFSRPEKNKNAYILEGFDENGWIYTNRKFATYTNLPEGKYVFKVKGSNGDGIWNASGTSINIKILPPWWRTIWAYLGYGLFFIGIIFSIDRIQRKRLISKAKERMKIQDAEHRAKTAELQSKVIQAENDRKTKELEEARQLQLSMLPKVLPQLPNLDIAVYMQTATEVGGDYYDFSVKEDGSLNIALGDATGHGMKAGTLVSMMKSLFTANSIVYEMNDFFITSNTAIKKTNMLRMMMSFAMINIKGYKAKLANAGMPPIYHFSNKLNKVEEIDLHGTPLGALSSTNFDNCEIMLDKNDILLLMSDGFPELNNSSNKMYSYGGVKEAFENITNGSPEEIINYLKSEVTIWTKDKDLEDDITFVVVKIK